MKIDDKTYGIMKNAIKAVVEHYGIAKVKLEIKRRERATLWALWHRAADDMNYDDTHPRYKSIKRIVPHTGFYIYANDDTINDDHINTALNRIAK